MSTYDFEMEVSSNNSLSLIIHQIDQGSSVLEFGCANGRMTKYLKEELNCRVTIVEYDEEAGKEASKYAEKAIVGKTRGNIELLTWKQELSNDTFDYIVFADVLEHLHNPESILKECKSFLNTRGKFLVTIPNLANNSVVAYLCSNAFDYSKTGLLDETHVHFFSLNSFRNMVNRLGCEMLYESATYSKIGYDEIPLDFNTVDPSLRKYLNERYLGSVYQFFFSFMVYDASYDHEKVTTFVNKNIGYYYSDLFLGSKGNEFNIHNVVRMNVQKGKNFIVKEHLNCEGRVLRFDVINTSAVVRLETVKVNGEMLTISDIEHNATHTFDNIFIFLHEDPNFYFRADNAIGQLEIEFEILDYELGNDNGAYFILLKEVMQMKDGLSKGTSLLEDFTTTNSKQLESIQAMSNHIRNLEELMRAKNDQIEKLKDIETEYKHVKKELDNVKASKLYSFIKKK